MSSVNGVNTLLNLAPLQRLVDLTVNTVRGVENVGRGRRWEGGREREREGGGGLREREIL